MILLWLCLITAPIVSPDPTLTPGALCTPRSEGYAGKKYSEQIPICARKVSLSKKKAVLRRYRMDLHLLSTVEIDHRIPLCLGGANTVENLAPQTWPEAKKKDVLEARLCAALRLGTIKQAAAVQLMLGWRP